GKVTAGKSSPALNAPAEPLQDLPVPTPAPPASPSAKESISQKARETLELIKKKQNMVAPSTPVPLTMDKQMPGTKLINSGSHSVIKLPPRPGITSTQEPGGARSATSSTPNNACSSPRSGK
ncbi:MAG TPA: hypothetical protein PKA06_00270, partial [Gemmatales bacterium]|nr:hypothetical protein [Gemmatales bacterium]